jgi:hypothetical protein
VVDQEFKNARVRARDAFPDDASLVDVPRWSPSGYGEPIKIWPGAGDKGDPLALAPWPSVQPPGNLDDDLDRVEGQLREAGMDLLAWYTPYHHAPGTWGIYLTEWGSDYLASQLGRADLALDALWGHEYFHFLTEVAATLGEVISTVPIYVRHATVTHHVPWLWCDIEEGLANATSLDRLGRRWGKTALRRFMRDQPHGYRDFGRYAAGKGGERRTKGYHALVADLLTPRTPGPVPFAELLFDEAERSVSPRDVPVYWVPRRATSGSTVELITTIPDIREADSFRKDLVKLPRSVQDHWETRTRRSLALGVRESAVNLEKLGPVKGTDATAWSVRVTKSVRAILWSRPSVGFEAVGIGHHDRAYRSAR